MQHDKKAIQEIADKVQDEYQMGGLSDGLYLDFATDVAMRYADSIRKMNTDEDFIGYMPYFASRIDGNNEKVELANDIKEIYNETVCYIPVVFQEKYYNEMRRISDQIISNNLIGKPFTLKEKPRRKNN